MKLSDSSCDLRHTELADTPQTFGSHQTFLSTTVTTVFEVTALLKGRWIPAQPAPSAGSLEERMEEEMYVLLRAEWSPSPRIYSHLTITCKEANTFSLAIMCFT